MKAKKIAWAFVASILAMNVAAASGPPFEFGAFRSVCTQVLLRPSAWTTPFVENIDQFNGAIAAAVEQRLRKEHLAYPVLHGKKCMTERPESPSQLSLEFYLHAEVDPADANRFVFALQMHTYFANRNAWPDKEELWKPHHEWPTRIGFCIKGPDQGTCISDFVVKYFDETAGLAIERAQELIRGQR